MGMKNSAQSFQRLIDSILRGIPGVYVYLDDLLLFSRDEESHLKLLEQVFQKLEAAGLAISLPKCEFGVKELNYLGYTINKEGIRPIQKKIAAIDNFPIPEKQKQLLAFLGALNYYRASLPFLEEQGQRRSPAEVLDPLYKLATCEIPKKTSFKELWKSNEKVQKAFVDAKKLLNNAATLNYPDPSAPIAMTSDASKFALGASIDQFVDGAWRPLSFWSKALKPQQQNYSTYRRELMAIQYSMRVFNEYFNGRDLIIWTDHRPIINSFKNQDLQAHDPIALNALNEIGMFTSDVRYKEGKKILVADWLSRPKGCPIGKAYEMEGNSIAKYVLPEDTLAALEVVALDILSCRR